MKIITYIQNCQRGGSKYIDPMSLRDRAWHLIYDANHLGLPNKFLLNVKEKINPNSHILTKELFL